MTASAGHDLNVAGSAIASLSAEHDVNIKAMDNSSHQSQGKNQTNITSSKVSSGGDLAFNAGRDLNAQAAQLTTGLNAALSAGRNVTLNAPQTGSYSEKHGNKRISICATLRQQGAGKTVQVTPSS